VTPLRRNRDFVLLQAGQLLSTAGAESTAIAYPLLVLALTHSPAKAGLVGFARFLPYPAFALLAGVAADRWNRKRLMLLADAVRALAVGSLVAAIALDRLTFWQIPVVAFVEGCCYVVFNIAETGALRSVVPARQLPQAAAAEQGRLSIVIVSGPPAGGALFGLGRALPFVFDVASYGASILSLLAMRTPFQEERARNEEPLRAQILEGLQWLWAQPFLRTCALIAGASNLAFEGLFLVLVVVARRQGLSSGTIGLMIACFGVCMLAGSVLAPVFQKLLPVRVIVVASFWTGIAFVGYIVHPDAWVLLACALPIAFLSPTLNSVVVGYRLALVPDRLTGRVNSVARNIALLAQPLGPLAAGLLLGGFSARTTVAIFCAWLIAIAAWTTLSPSIRDAPSLDELDRLETASTVPAA
jgi:MFS family permease